MYKKTSLFNQENQINTFYLFKTFQILSWFFHTSKIIKNLSAKKKPSTSKKTFLTIFQLE